MCDLLKKLLVDSSEVFNAFFLAQDAVIEELIPVTNFLIALMSANHLSS